MTGSCIMMDIDRLMSARPTNHLNKQLLSRDHVTNEATDQKDLLQIDGALQKEDIQTVVDQLNGFIEPLRTNLQFILHDKLEEYYVTVIDVETEEVIREIPPKEILDTYAAMAEYMGLLVDEKV